MKDQKSVYQKLEVINAQKNPWQNDSEYHRKSFSQLLSLISKAPHKSILEVGCAQGEFTKLLKRLSDDVTGIDVSESAIRQAQENVRGVKFVASSLEDFSTEKHYDVIVCSEILYYIKDRKMALKKLRELGDYLVTSNFIFCLPQVSLSSALYEMNLRSRFKLLEKIVYPYAFPPTITLQSLWRMN